MFRKYEILFCQALLVALVGCISACSSVLPASSTSLPATLQPSLTTTSRLVSVTPDPSPTSSKPTPIHTVMVTRTPMPTYPPRPTMTAVFLSLPAGVSQLTPFFTPAFPVTKSSMFFAETPTPIATPIAGNYQLKKWSEADGLMLLRKLNQAAYDTDIPSLGDFRGTFLDYQLANKIAAREYLLRYPNSENREQVEWLLAFTNTLDRRDSDEWLVAEIARRINHGWLNPLDLTSGLEPLGFVAYPIRFDGRQPYGDQDLPLEPVMNLFGDDLPAYIWEIQNSEEGYYGHGLYLAVEQLPDSSFRVARIYSKHNFPFSGGPQIEAQDLTGDGQPELVVTEVGCEFGCNILNVYIYQWKEDRFVELSHGNFGSAKDDVSGELTWEFGQQSQNGSALINITDSYMLEPVRHRSLTWNGDWFQIGERRMELPGTEFLSVDKFQGWIGYAMEYAEFNEIQPLFEFLLENPPKGQGTAFPDFIRFQMAMVDALSSRVGPAREQLQKIVDVPSDPASLLVASAATAFLKDYQSDADIFRSCQAALSVMDRSLKPLRNANPQLNPQVIFDKWGFTPVNSLCSPRAAFRLLLHNLNLKPGDDVTARLRQEGVPVLRSLKADFDGNNLFDWLVVVDTPASESAVEAWVFVNNGEDYSAIPVFDYDTGFPGYPIDASNTPIRVDTFPLPGDHKPAIILQAGEQMDIFVVHHKDLTSEVELLETIKQVESFVVDSEANELKVTFSPRAYDNYNDIYQWKDRLANFLNISQVDRLLFDQKNPGEAISVIQAKLSNINPDSYNYENDASRLYYMLGLAYELQGNSYAAVETFLKVWREFPSSPYALMAREKIQ